MFRGVALFNDTLDRAKSFLQSLDPNLELDSDGFTSNALGLGVYVFTDDAEGELGEMLSIIIFEKGYYGTRE